MISFKKNRFRTIITPHSVNSEVKLRAIISILFFISLILFYYSYCYSIHIVCCSILLAKFIFHKLKRDCRVFHFIPRGAKKSSPNLVKGDNLNFSYDYIFSCNRNVTITYLVLNSNKTELNPVNF